MKSLLLILLTIYYGRVTDIYERGIGFATVYPVENPIEGTATNDKGFFRLSTDLPDTSTVIVSFIGYEKQTLKLSQLGTTDAPRIILHEQPVKLNEVVVTAKGKRKNMRKEMTSLLARVLYRMQNDFNNAPYASQIVSDVSMLAEGEPWGMEQMSATTVTMPMQGAPRYKMTKKKREGLPTDSIQFVGQYCKRFFDTTIRARTDTLLASKQIDKMHPNFRPAANAIDSGTIVHQSLWSIGNILYDFQDEINDLDHWTVAERGDEKILTYTVSQNIIGIFIYTMLRHYIVDASTLTVLRFSETMKVELNIPFGYRVKDEELKLLNMLNMTREQINKYRIRHVQGEVSLNTYYKRQERHLYVSEKNMVADVTIVGKMQGKKDTIPLHIRASQHVTHVQTQNVQPFPAHQLNQRVPRIIVELEDY